MVYAANYWLNMFPRKGGVSKTLSPHALLTGQSWSYTTHCKLEFGDYVQTHEEHNNSMAARTIGAIALSPTGNTQGGYFLFSLTTGRVLNRGRWTSLPMPNEVIDWVHRMAHQEHGNNGLLFEDRNHNQLVDPDDDREDHSTYHPKEDDNSDDDDNGVDDDADPNPPHDPVYNNLPGHLEENVDQINHDDQQAEPENNEVGDDEELPTNNQNAEHSTNDVEEQMPNDNENDEVPVDNNNGNDDDEVPIDNNNRIPTNPNDPTLPPRVRRELNRLANDGVGPTTYQGRTRSQTQQPGHNMTTTKQLEASTPLPYKHMTNFEKELFHR